MDSSATPSEDLVFSAITSQLSAGLCWVERAAYTEFSLQTGEDIVATLRLSDPAGSVATGRSASEAWSFEDEGLVKPCVLARLLPEKVPLAVHQCKFPGLPSSLEFPDGRRFRWRRLGFFTRAYRFEDAENKPLIVVRFDCCRSWLSGSRVIRGSVDIQPKAYMLSELTLILLLSWYLIVRARNCEIFRIPL
jgi:hypothetical protein